MEPHRGSARLAYGFLVFAALAWAGNFVLGRAVHADIPPIALSFWRWTTALAILLPFTLRGVIRDRAILRREAGYFALLGLVGIATFHSLVYIGLNRTSATNAGLVYATVPVFVAIFARLIWGDRIRPVQYLGIVVSIAGVAVLLAEGELAALMALRFNPGDVWLFAATAVWGLYTVLAKRQPRDLSRYTGLTAILLFGVPMILPFYLWESLTGRTMPLTWQAAVAVGYVAVFASVLAYIAFNSAVAIVGPNRTGPFANLTPAFAIVLGIAFLGESLHFYHLAGIALIAVGVWCASILPARTKGQ